MTEAEEDSLAERWAAASEAYRKRWEHVAQLVVAFAPHDRKELTEKEADRLHVSTLIAEKCVDTDGFGECWLTGRGRAILSKLGNQDTKLQRHRDRQEHSAD